MKAPSFPVLVFRLAQEHHDGALLRMSEASDLPQSTLWRWLRALPSQHNPHLIRRLCRRYDLPFMAVWRILERDRAVRVAGRKIELPDLSQVRRGPVPGVATSLPERRVRRRRRVVAPMVAGAMLAGLTASAHAATPAVVQTAAQHHEIIDRNPAYRKRRSGHSANPRRRWGQGFPDRRAA